MDAFGINWTYLLVQLGTCIGVLLLLGVIIAVFRFKQPTKLFKIFIGLATGWVTLLTAFLLVLGIIVLVFNLSSSSSGFDLAFVVYEQLMPVNMATLYLMLLLIIYYLFHIFKSSVHQSKQRIPYAIALLIIPVIVMPIYYFKFIRRNETPTT